MNNQEIFPNWQYPTGFAYHNIRDVLQGSNVKELDPIDHHYGARAGHIPQTKHMGVLVSQPDERITQQAAYLGKLIGKDLTVHPLDEHATNRTLVVPYINTPGAESRLKSRGFEVWGLPSALVARLKNKAELHRLAGEAHIENFALPEHTICTIEQIPEEGFKLLAKTEQLYAETGLAKIYPNGLVIRAAEADGNYGAAVLRPHKNSVEVIPDGNPSRSIVLPNWPSALQKAAQDVSQTINPDFDNRVVISRWLDLADSPGLSVVISNGEAVSLGWNGQVKEPNGTACVGTSSYHPKNPLQEKYKKEFEETTANSFIKFLIYSCKRLGIDFSDVCGITNVDLMLPGQLEIELQNRLKRRVEIYVAEINPRWTNWTDAVAMVGLANNFPQTTESMSQTIRAGVLTADKFSTPIPSSVPIKDVRDAIQETNYRLASSGSGVIFRMPDRPHVGLIFHGDIPLAVQSTKTVLESLR